MKAGNDKLHVHVHAASISRHPIGVVYIMQDAHVQWLFVLGPRVNRLYNGISNTSVVCNKHRLPDETNMHWAIPYTPYG